MLIKITLIHPNDKHGFIASLINMLKQNDNTDLEIVVMETSLLMKIMVMRKIP